MGEGEKEMTEERNKLVFAVNGERFELSSVEPSTTLLEFLRLNTRFKSVKLSCGEGGCGACVVLLSRYDPVNDEVDDFTISSCLTLLHSINYCSITTSEGLGNSKAGFHAIHQRFAGFHASQCGFCTPGMCLSLFGALLNADKSHRPEPSPGFSKLTVAEAEKAISGNLCRCTGFRPIVDACKSFASDVDIEDLGYNSFWKKGEDRGSMLARLPAYDRQSVCTFPGFLKEEIKANHHAVLNPVRSPWSTPGSVSELQKLLLELQTTENGGSVKLVAGNTGTGYYKEHQDYDWYIDIRNIPELLIMKRDQTGIEIGAAVTISNVIKFLRKEEMKGEPSPHPDDHVLERIANHIEKIATPFVRNSGTIGGNLVMAQSKGFPSDIATILLPVGASVNLICSGNRKKITVEEFLQWPPLESHTVLSSIEIPFWSLSKTDANLLFETYRASPRPLGSALAYLNAAFLADVCHSESSEGVVINSCRLAFGAYGTKNATRATNVENFLTGKVLDNSVLYEAIQLLRDSIVPSDGTSSAAYRSSLAVGYLFEFVRPFTEAISFKLSNGSIDGYKSYLPLEDEGTDQNRSKPDHDNSSVMISSAQQIHESKDFSPVGEPIIKSGASLQASGEAVFVDDIPSPDNCLYGAFIYSTKPLARVKAISFKENSLPDGVFAVITYKDIPKDGLNIGCRTMLGTEPLFCDGVAQCAGDRIALVVADTQKHADMTANLAVVEYDIEDLGPILSVEDAVERQSWFQIPPFLALDPVGDISKGMAEADSKSLSCEIRLPSQYFFYMETQTALAVPDEDDCILVYSSIQNPEFLHSTVARCLGIPEHNVRIITRRLGGAFGGKAIKPMPIATACALAAHKLQRPVRTYLNRKTDMIMVGGRHPMKITYDVGYKLNGKITALQLEILIDAGMAIDISPMLPYNILGTLKKYDWGALAFDVKVCKTNLPSRTAMRAPGETQGSYIAEAIIEHVASTLGLEPDTVRSINFHTHDTLKRFHSSAGEPSEYTLPTVWDKIAVSSNFNERRALVKEFNRHSKWRKRGISRVPVLYEVMMRPKPGRVSILSDGSVAVEVGGTEMGQGLYTKVKQTTAYALGAIKCNGNEDLLEKIRVIQTDSLSMIQGGFTAGSTASEGSCEVVRRCCDVLVQRLSPLRDNLMEQTGSVSWDYLICQAYLQSVNLSASTLFTPELSNLRYLNYGAAVSEVEMNILTGETTVLRTDIIYDCGKSLNPAVDLGQIEGAFIQGLGFFMLEEYVMNSDGLIVTDSTWTYKIPTVDKIPRHFNVEILNSQHNKKRVLSSKASGEPPLLLAASVHCATRAAVGEARKQFLEWSGDPQKSHSVFQLPVPATMPVVKELCGLNTVEKYLEWKLKKEVKPC